MAKPKPRQKVGKRAGEGEGPDAAAPGLSMSAIVPAINKLTLELSPAVTAAQAYLGAGLASQVGFFSNANHYQQQSMAAMATVAESVNRLSARRSKGNRPAPKKADKQASEERDASSEVRKALRQAARAVRDCGF